MKEVRSKIGSEGDWGKIGTVDRKRDGEGGAEMKGEMKIDMERLTVMRNW